MSRAIKRLRIVGLSVAIVALRLIGGHAGALAEVLLTIDRDAARKELL